MKRHYYFTLLCALTLFFAKNVSAQGPGKAYDFSSNHILIPNDASLNSDNITVEAWVKADAYAVNIWENVIVSKDGWGSGDEGYALRCGANGSLSFNISVGGTWAEVASTPMMSTGKWYHVAGSYDGSTMRLYINGELVDSLSISGIVDHGSYDVAIGKAVYTIGGNRYFDGNIDEVRIWNTAIPQSSIQEYMCKNMSITHPEYLNLVAHYNFDAAGPVIDQSPLGNDGTVVGPTQVNSGAAIGDESVYVYNVAPNFTLANGTQDSVTVASTSVFNTVHIYRVNGAPTNSATALDSIDNSHYYGVYAGNQAAYSYTATYEYGAGSTFFNGAQSYGVLGARTSGSVPAWTSSPATHDVPNSSMTATFSTSKEFLLATECPSLNLSPSTPQAFCQGDSVTISDNGSATIRQWYDANGPIAGATGTSITATTSGSYYLIGNDASCSDTSQAVTVTVNPIPVADFGTIASSYCDTDPNHTLTNGSPVGGTYSGPGILNGVFKPSMTGIGTFTLIYAYSDMLGCSDSDTVTVDIYDTPAAPTITQNGADLCVTAVTGMSYAWYENGTLIAGATANCYTALNNGNYTCELIGNGGCAAASNVYNLNDLSLEAATFDAAINVMPNPAKDWITVSTNEANVQFTVTVFDEQGRKMLDINEENSNHTINLAQFEKGIYFLHLNGNGQQTVRKVVLK